MVRRTLATLTALAIPLTVLAVSFPDVPTGHLYKQQIEALADKGIVKGNPDGTFKPENTVNRAEMLTMLYRINGKTPAAPSKTCFKDVPLTAWYAGVVCDAAKNGYVNGYSDGNFRPENAVNRVESLKMIHTVLRLPLSANASTSPLTAYTDVSLTAWYATYMANAFEKRILPIAGQEGTKFYPEWPLKRGEAAVYLFNAMGLSLTKSSSSAAAARSSSSLKEQETVAPLSVDFPFEDDGTFTAKKSKVYTFSLTANTVGSVDVSVDAGSSVQCRLYKLDATTSFSLEYYIGQVVDNTCSMRVALGAGNYQLEVVPSVPNISFTLATRLTTGDNNDGFRQASSLPLNTPKTGFLESDDYGEFYTFTISTQAVRTLTVTGTDAMKCLIYPMADVDLYGFSGPECGSAYDFPPGTYYVGVVRQDQDEDEESFTIKLQ